MSERYVGTNVVLLLDGHGQQIGYVDAGPFEGTAAEEVSRAAFDAGFPPGSFTITGTLEVKVCTHQLDAMLIRPTPAVESEPRSRECQPWQKRKKGRGGYGY